MPYEEDKLQGLDEDAAGGAEQGRRPGGARAEQGRRPGGARR